MLFSSLIFLFVFLPIVLGMYFILCRKSMLAKNILLLFASLFFYAWGEPKFVLVMILSIIGNYFFGLKVGSNADKKWRKVILSLAVAFNLGILFVFKYLNFAVSNLNILLGDILPQPEIVLPIGISFFTFQAMSYVIDVYRGTVEIQRNPFYLALYISFFPQLIAGPIVRYSTIEAQIRERRVTRDDFAEGVRRFLIGISKKVILSNNFAIIADQAYTMVEDGTLSVGFAWLGSIAYTLQIFFDFSAYSDMAIGLGRIFGFHFLENFDYPYTSKSVSEFWRRWHISLGMWFRDYVYIPLGGSRVNSKLTLVRNLFAVWILTGIWHGANWTFIMWGLVYFAVLTVEKLLKIPDRWKSTAPKVLYSIFTLLLVNAQWVLFRAESLGQALTYLGIMLGIGTDSICDNMLIQYFTENWVLLLVGVIYSAGIFKVIRKKMAENRVTDSLADWTGLVVYNMLFIVSVSYLVIGAYNPFIYFNF